MRRPVAALALALLLSLLSPFQAPSFAQAVATTHAQLHTITATPDATAARSGAWSDPETWTAGAVPGARAKVAIPTDLTVTIDREVTTAYNWIRVDGTLRFQPDVNTQLVTETLVAMGRLEIGTVEAPIADYVTARLVFQSPGGPINHTLDPLELTRGLIAMSPVSIVGSAKQEISALAGFPGVGATSLTLEKDPTNWRAGDELVVTPTIWGQDEVVTIDAIEGHVVTFSPGLKYTRTNVPNDPAIRVHVGNLTRNVILQTDPAQAGKNPVCAALQPCLQGHVMLMGGGHDIRNAAFLDLGRTTIKPVTDPVINADGTRDPSLMPLCGVPDENVRSRYALHFHNAGPDSAPSTVEGVVVRVKRDADLKIGIINHSSYVFVRRSIVHQVDGAGLFTEEGDERGAFVGNLVVHSNGSNKSTSHNPGRWECEQNNYLAIWDRRRQDEGHRGAGVWLQGNNVPVVGNIFAGHTQAGIDHSANPLNDPNKKDVPRPLIRPDHLHDGDPSWVIAKLGPIDLTKPQLLSTVPVLLLANNQIYAIGNDQRYPKKAAIRSDALNTQLAGDWGRTSIPRPRNLITGLLAWNVANCISTAYSSYGRIEHTTCIAGDQYPKSRAALYDDARDGINTMAQSGFFWDYDDVRIDGFGLDNQFFPSKGSFFKDVTIDGKPYVPTIEACGDGIDNDGNGLIDEGCLP